MKKLILYFSVLFLFQNCTKANDEKSILIVTSNQHTYGNLSKNTANHFAEIVLAYDIFIKNGYSVDFISPKGGAIPIGYISTSDSIQKMYLYDTNFMNKLKNTKNPTEINIENYKAIYFSGGGSAMFGIANNKSIKNIAQSIYYNNGIISAVCHGTAGIALLKDKQGNPLYSNKKISGYPDLFENTKAEYYRTFPFSIENKIRENNGTFLYSEKKKANFYIVDGNFITGQDPSSTVSVATEVVKSLNNQ